MAKYTDFKVNFDIHPNTGDLALDKDEMAIKRAVYNIIFTNKYEHFHNASVGGGLARRLFENHSSTTDYEISSIIKEAVQNEEPRVTDVFVSTSMPTNSQGILVKVVVTVINIPTPIVIETLLRRVR